jgi:dihydrofolate reductase
LGKLVAGMTVSLDGFVADRNGSNEALYPDLEDLQGGEFMNSLIAETGSVLMGRTTFDMSEDPDWYAGNYEFQVPIFVVTHRPPAIKPKEDENISFTFVTEGVEASAALARDAAGDRSVTVVGGPNLIQQLLRAGLVDELHVDVMPLLLGDGLPLFEPGARSCSNRVPAAWSWKSCRFRRSAPGRA